MPIISKSISAKYDIIKANRTDNNLLPESFEKKTLSNAATNRNFKIERDISPTIKFEPTGSGIFKKPKGPKG